MMMTKTVRKRDTESFVCLLKIRSGMMFNIYEHIVCRLRSVDYIGLNLFASITRISLCFNFFRITIER